MPDPVPSGPLLMDAQTFLASAGAAPAVIKPRTLVCLGFSGAATQSWSPKNECLLMQLITTAGGVLILSYDGKISGDLSGSIGTFPSVLAVSGLQSGNGVELRVPLHPLTVYKISSSVAGHGWMLLEDTL